jgi:molybdopterin-guanine dinucleotide biosynthesis protein A
VTFTREDPPLGGPVAGLLTGVDILLRPARLIWVLAVDMPRVSARTFRRLREATTSGEEGRDGAFLHDPTGRRQLCGVLTAEALARVRPDLEGQHGMSLRSLLAELDLAEVAAIGDESRDIDTWADLRDLDA